MMKSGYTQELKTMRYFSKSERGIQAFVEKLARVTGTIVACSSSQNMREFPRIRRASNLEEDEWL